MKLQRYTPEIDKITSDHCRAAMVKTDAVGGYWVRDDAVEALEAENAALHAECDRLAAMIGPQNPMSAEEVAEPGFYWWKFADHRRVIVIARYDDSKIVIKTILGDEIFIGKFIGPIKFPGVSDA